MSSLLKMKLRCQSAMNSRSESRRNRSCSSSPQRLWAVDITAAGHGLGGRSGCAESVRKSALVGYGNPGPSNNVVRNGGGIGHTGPEKCMRRVGDLPGNRLGHRERCPQIGHDLVSTPACPGRIPSDQHVQTDERPHVEEQPTDPPSPTCPNPGMSPNGRL